MMITMQQAIDLGGAHPCDPNQHLRPGELPVWRPGLLRHEHKFDEVETNTFQCSECGYTTIIESPEPGEGECH